MVVKPSSIILYQNRIFLYFTKNLKKRLRCIFRSCCSLIQILGITCMMFRIVNLHCPCIDRWLQRIVSIRQRQLLRLPGKLDSSNFENVLSQELPSGRYDLPPKENVEETSTAIPDKETFLKKLRREFCSFFIAVYNSFIFKNFNLQILSTNVLIFRGL